MSLHTGPVVVMTPVTLSIGRGSRGTSIAEKRPPCFRKKWRRRALKARLLLGPDRCHPLTQRRRHQFARNKEAIP
jgi:hypothetical protein